MTKKILLVCISLIIVIRSAAQNTYVNYRYGPSSYSMMYAVNAFVNIYNDAKWTRLAREEATAKIGMLRHNYDSYQSFPDSITTGWHNVIATDNLDFCREAKVHVENNRIMEFVIDNCIRLNFTSIGPIKKGKNIVTLQNFNDEQLEVVDVYFIYDMEGPVIADPPIEPGYVTLWTGRVKFINERIIFDDMVFDGVTKRFNAPPECFAGGTFSLTLKPGTYKFRAMKSGNDHDGVIEVKSGQCLIYELY